MADLDLSEFIPGETGTATRSARGDKVPPPPAPPTDEAGSPAVWTLLGEAGSDPVHILPVAATIINRQKKSGAASPDAVVTDTGNGYEAWTDAKAREATKRKYPVGSPAYEQAQETLQEIEQNGVPDQFKGFDTFYSPNAQSQKGRAKPKWDDGSGVNIGGNVFFADKYAAPKAGEGGPAGDAGPSGAPGDVDLSSFMDTGPPPGEKPTPKKPTPLGQARAAPPPRQFKPTPFLPNAADIPKDVGHQFMEGVRANEAESKVPFSPLGEDMPLGPFGSPRGIKQATNTLASIASPITGLAESVIGRPVAAVANAVNDRFHIAPKMEADPEAIGNIASMALGGAGELGEARTAAKAGQTVEAYRAAQAAALPARKPNALAEVLTRRTPQEQAERMVVKRIQRDTGRAPTAQEMLDHAARTPEKPMTLMDVGGPATKGLAGMVARSPKGEGGPRIQNFLAERSNMQGPRLESDVQRQIGAGSSRQTIKSLQDAQKEAAKPLYEDAYEANPIVRSSVVDQIVRSKQGSAAWKEAQSRAKGWVVGTDNPVPDKYSLRTLDQLKQVFDDRISVARRQGNNGEAALYQGLKNRLVTELDTNDRSDGLYAKARKTYSNSAQSQDAVEFGRKALSMNPEDIHARLRDMSPGDRELARLGLAESVREKIQSTDVGRNAATKLARNPALQMRLAPFFRSPKAQERFIDSAVAEDTMFRTENEVVKGSQTAARAAEDRSDDARVIGHGLHAARHLASGNIPGAAVSAGRAAYEFARRPNPAVGEHIADILTAPVSSNNLARALLERGAPRSGGNALKAAQMRALASRRAPAVAGAVGLGGPQSAHWDGGRGISIDVGGDQ